MFFRKRENREKGIKKKKYLFIVLNSYLFIKIIEIYRPFSLDPIVLNYFS